MSTRMLFTVAIDPSRFRLLNGDDRTGYAPEYTLRHTADPHAFDGSAPPITIKSIPCLSAYVTMQSTGAPG